MGGPRPEVLRRISMDWQVEIWFAVLFRGNEEASGSVEVYAFYRYEETQGGVEMNEVRGKVSAGSGIVKPVCMLVADSDPSFGIPFLNLEPVKEGERFFVDYQKRPYPFVSWETRDV